MDHITSAEGFSACMGKACQGWDALHSYQTAHHSIPFKDLETISVSEETSTKNMFTDQTKFATASNHDETYMPWYMESYKISNHTTPKSQNHLDQAPDLKSSQHMERSSGVPENFATDLQAVFMPVPSSAIHQDFGGLAKVYCI
jgi:hypothetical protein